jgi:hypothetical protein
MTDICYDTEFLEDGKTIDLISIGMVAGDGREYYAITYGEWLRHIGYHDWLLANVAPSLPLKVEPIPTRGSGIWNRVTWDRDHPAWPHVKPREQIAGEVRDFILAGPDPQLWADYCAYDHIALCQLWGAMIDKPEGVPMWTHDLRREWEQAGCPEMPSLPGASGHNALSDAREVAYRLKWLRDRA